MQKNPSDSENFSKPVSEADPGDLDKPTPPSDQAQGPLALDETGTTPPPAGTETPPAADKIEPVPASDAAAKSAEKAPESMPVKTASVAGPLVHQVRIPDILPLLPVRDAVAFPGAVIPLSIGRDKSRRLLDEVMPADKTLGVITQKNDSVEDPQASDLYSMGTVSVVVKMVRHPEGQQSIVVHGLMRFRILEVVQTEPYLKARVEPLADAMPEKPTSEFLMLVQSVRQAAQRMIELSPNIPDEANGILNEIESPGALADFLAANLNESVAEKQSLLEEVDVTKRLERVREKLATRIELLELQETIQKQVRSSIDKTQRKYFLQEQLKAIQKELGGEEESSEEVADLRKRIDAARVPEVVKKETDRELSRLANIPQASPEFGVIRSFLETVAELPWSVSTPDKLDIQRAKAILDRDHYDLEKIKKRIVEFLAVRKLNPTGHGPILCFLGPPGVGKTSLGKSIAASLGRKFARMSLGGVRDEADIRGHRRTYIGAMPGRIVQELRKCGANNPVMMLDEIDKLGADFRGDPAAALLEVLDPQQNATFEDHYLGVPFDLSRTIFICTANYMEPVPPALKDRMEIIEIPGYTQKDKLLIARKYLVPRQLAENGITARQCAIRVPTLAIIIDQYTREAGVRSLERAIGSVARGIAARLAETIPSRAARGTAQNKAAAKFAPSPDVGTSAPSDEPNNKDGQITKPATADNFSQVIRTALKKAPRITVKPADLPQFLGPPMFESEVALRTATPGVATGLAYTPFGGDILFVEATRMPGKGRLKLTGQIGEVMRESAQAAYSLLKSNAQKLHLDAVSFSQTDVHIHVPAGAVPKDGPSAGVAMYTALASLFLNRPVRPDLAMTGEITLRGLVLPIGGVKEKVIAAQRAGIRRVILPQRNRKHIDEVSAQVRKDVSFVFVENVDEVLRQAFSLADTPHLERESQKKSPVRPRKGRLKIPRHRAAHQ